MSDKNGDGCTAATAVVLDDAGGAAKRAVVMDDAGGAAKRAKTAPEVVVVEPDDDAEGYDDETGEGYAHTASDLLETRKMLEELDDNDSDFHEMENDKDKGWINATSIDSPSSSSS